MSRSSVSAGSPILRRLDGGNELLDQLLVDAGGCHDSARGGEVWARVDEALQGDASDGGVDVGVIEDDDGGLASELGDRLLGNDVRSATFAMWLASAWASPVTETSPMRSVADQGVADVRWRSRKGR